MPWALPSSRLARRQRGDQVLSYSIRSAHSTNKQQQWGNALCLWNNKNCSCENTAPSLPQCCAEVSAALNVSRRPAQRSQLQLIVSILSVKSRSLLTACPLLQVGSGQLRNAQAQSESSLLSSRRAWEHVEVFLNTCQVDLSVWEACTGFLDWFAFSWFTYKIK